jgi:hypothetical protein
MLDDNFCRLHGGHRGGAFEDEDQRRRENVGGLHTSAACKLCEQSPEPFLVCEREGARMIGVGRLHGREDEWTAMKPYGRQHLGVHLQHFGQFPFGRVMRRGALFDVIADLFAPALQRLEHQRVFGTEEVVDSGFGEPGAVGDPIGGDGVQPFAVEQLARRFHKPFAVRWIPGHKRVT